MKKNLILFLLIILSIGARAQTAGSYAFSAFGGTYTSVTGGTPVAILDDDLTVTVPLNLNFNFCGITYTTASVCSNGWISFGTNTSTVWTNETTPASLAPIVPCVMPLFDDLYGFGCSASYITTGIAPNRVFTMEWKDWQWYISGVGTISFEVKLYESTNVIQFIYNSPATPVVNALGGGATIGIAKSVTDYQDLNNTSAAPVSSCSVYTFNIITKPATGQIYQYTPPPVPVVNNNGPVCSGSPVTITATSTLVNPTYNFTGPFTGSPISNTTGVLIINPTSAANNGVYSVTVNSGCGVSAAGTTTVVISPAPVISFGSIASPSTCTSTDGSITLNGLANSTNYTLKYRKGGVTQPQISMTSTSTGSYVLGGLSSGTYDSIRVTTALGCTSNVLGPITLSSPSAPAAPVAGYNPPLCAGSTLVLFVPSQIQNGVYQWTGPGGYTATGNPVSRQNMVPAFAGPYVVTVTVSGCISPAGTVNVVVAPPDAAPVPNNVSYCQFDQAVPITANGQNLRWYTSASSAIDSFGSFIAPTPSTLVATTLQYYVTQTITCESPRVLLTVTIKPKPAPPTIINTTITYCQFAFVPPLSVGGQNLIWYITPTGGAGSSTAPTPSTLTPGTTNYYVSQTVNGCTSDRQHITVIVLPKPPPPQVVSPYSVCQYDNVQLSATGQNLKWYNTPAGGGGVSVAPTVITGYEDSFYFYVTQTVNGCESDRAKMQVIVNYKPNGIILPTTPWVCQGFLDTFNYFGNARPDAVYNWKTSQPQSQIISGGGQGPLVVRFDSAGTQVVRLTVNNKGCISPLITQIIYVRPLPLLSYVSKKDVCVNEVVNIALNGTAGHIAIYNWNFDGGTPTYQAQDGGPYGIVWTVPGIKYVSVTAIADLCTSKPVIDTVTVHAPPSGAFNVEAINSIIYSPPLNQIPNTIRICDADTLLLHAVYEDGATYRWSPAGFFFPANNDGLSYQVRGLVRQSGYVKLEVTSKYGCIDSSSKLVETQHCCNVYFPNVFSPNSDGRNDIFRPVTAGHQEGSFRVTNRWGQVVYENRNERNGWDGTYNNEPQDMGTYYYFYHYKCSDGKYYDAKGEFLLMR